jgi:hypothetical protein
MGAGGAARSWQIVELLGRNRVLLKDCYLHYTAQDKAKLDSLDTLSRAELLAFCKDNRLAPRVIQNIPALFRASRNSPAPSPSPGPTSSGAGALGGADEELNMHEFFECVVRIARDLHPGQTVVGANAAPQAGGSGGSGRDSLLRRLQQLLQAVAKYSGAKVCLFLSHLCIFQGLNRCTARPSPYSNGLALCCDGGR